MQKSVQARKNRIISTKSGQFQSGLPIFKTNRNTNRGSYEYTQEQVDAMFQALEGRVAEVKARFTPKKAAESKTFSFGTTE